MWKIKHLFFVGALALVVPAVTARAALMTTYSYYYTAGQSSYNVAPGGSVTVPVYLQEVNSDQSSNSFLVNEHGLSEAGVNVSYFSGSSAFTLTAAAPNAGTPPTGFDDSASAGTVNSSTSATITESTDPAPFGTDLIGVMAGPQTNGVSNLYLGTVTIHGSSVAGQSSIFSVGVVDPGIGSTFTNDSNYDLDNNGDPFNPSDAASIYSSAAGTNFTVSTIVPEPTSFSIIAASATLLLRRHRMRASSNRSPKTFP